MKGILNILKSGLGRQKDPLDTSRYFLGIRKSALLEIFLFLGVVVLCSYLFSSGDRYIDVRPHPFWVVVLLITLQYSTAEALAAAVLASACLLLGNLPEHEVTQTTYEWLFEVFYRPILWGFMAVVLGGIRSRQLDERTELRVSLRNAKESAEIITEAYNRLKKVKEGLEARLAGELRSSLTAYKAAKSLESLSPAHILLAVEDVVLSIMEPKAFSIYSLGPNGFEAATCYGWESEHYERRIMDDKPMFKVIAEEKRILCAINEDDEKLLAGEGMLAGPLFNPENKEVFGMLKIEELGFMTLNLNNIETFKVLCEWVGMSYANAVKYQETKAESILNERQTMLSGSYYKHQVKHLLDMADHIGMDVSLIRIKAKGFRRLSEAEKGQLIMLTLHIAQKFLHPFDQVFDSAYDKSEFMVLLPGRDFKAAEEVLSRMEQGFKHTNEAVLHHVDISFAAEGLYSAKGRTLEKSIEEKHLDMSDMVPAKPVNEMPAVVKEEDVVEEKIEDVVEEGLENLEDEIEQELVEEKLEQEIVITKKEKDEKDNEDAFDVLEDEVVSDHIKEEAAERLLDIEAKNVSLEDIVATLDAAEENLQRKISRLSDEDKQKLIAELYKMDEVSLEKGEEIASKLEDASAQLGKVLMSLPPEDQQHVIEKMEALELLRDDAPEKEPATIKVQADNEPGLGQEGDLAKTIEKLVAKQVEQVVTSENVAALSSKDAKRVVDDEDDEDERLFAELKKRLKKRKKLKKKALKKKQRLERQQASVENVKQLTEEDLRNQIRHELEQEMSTKMIAKQAVQEELELIEKTRRTAKEAMRDLADKLFKNHDKQNQAAAKELAKDVVNKALKERDKVHDKNDEKQHKKPKGKIVNLKMVKKDGDGNQQN